jgi:hypothetical protein
MDLVDPSSGLYSRGGKFYKLVKDDIYQSIATGMQFVYHAGSDTLRPYLITPPSAQLSLLGFKKSEIDALETYFGPADLEVLIAAFRALGGGVPSSLVVYLVQHIPGITPREAATLAGGISNEGWHLQWTINAVAFGLAPGVVCQLWRLVEGGGLNEHDFEELAKAIKNGGQIQSLAINFSTRKQREQVRSLAQKLQAPDGGNVLQAMGRIINELKEIVRFLPSGMFMLHDEDPILRLLSEAFQFLLDRVNQNKKLVHLFTTAPGLKIQGVSLGLLSNSNSNSRTFLNYLKEAATDCSQAVGGELDEWIGMITKFFDQNK